MTRKALLAVLFAPALAHAQEPKALETKITAVTVYADRAQVTRTAQVTLPARIAIAKLPGWIDEESVRVTLTPPDAGRIVDVTVEKRFLAEASEESVRKAEAALRETTDDMAAIDDEQRVLAAEIAQLEAIRAFSLDKLPKDMATREVKVGTFGETVDFVTTRLRKARAAIRDNDKKKRELQPQLVVRSKALDEVRTKAQLEQRDVVVELTGEGRATLSLTYLTPGATWEPVAELRAGGKAKVGLAQYAAVVQTSGEDWDGATLAFSTQRPADLLKVPEAEGLLLGAGGAGLAEVLTRAGESFQRAQSAYSSQNMLLNKGKANFEANIANQMAMQARVVQSFEQLQERGTTAHFAALSGRTIRADGKTVRVPIGSVELEAASRVVAVPEVSLNAVRTADLVNAGAQPLLPGKVALFVDGAFVGNSELGFVAPGESFSTFLGVNDRVKLSRTIDKKRSSIERRGKKTKLAVSFLVTAENLSDEAVTLEMGDRVPVAQTNEIEVVDPRLPAEAKRDSSGVLRWNAQLPPHKKQSWRVEYTLEYPTDLLARAPAPHPAAKRTVYDDIRSLEQSL